MSPKNKGKFGKAKTAVEPDDEFLSTMARVGKALEPHAMKIVIGVLSTTALLVVIFGYRSCMEKREKNATELYAQALVLAGVPVVPQLFETPTSDTGERPADAGDKPPDAGDKTAQASPETPEQPQGNFAPKDENDDGIPDAFPSRVQRARRVLEVLGELYANYGSTEVARRSRLLQAAMLYDTGEYQAARDMFEKVVSSASNQQMKIAAREGMGEASEALAMAIEDPAQKTAALQKTLELYRDIQRADKGPGWDLALYHSARILALMGKPDEARQALEKALDDVPETSLSQDIKQRLALLGQAR